MIKLLRSFAIGLALIAAPITTVSAQSTDYLAMLYVADDNGNLVDSFQSSYDSKTDCIRAIVPKVAAIKKKFPQWNYTGICVNAVDYYDNDKIDNKKDLFIVRTQ